MTDFYVKIDGGIGRCIAATGAVEKFAKEKVGKGDTVFVVSGFPYVFEGLDDIERVYPLNTPYLYEDKIKTGEFLEPEPYNHSLYYRENEHLATVFNFLLNGKREFVQPKIVLTKSELEAGKQMVEKMKKESGKDKVMLVQPWGSQGGKIVPDSNPIEVMPDETYRSFTVGFVEKLGEAFRDEFDLYSVRVNGQLDYKDFKPMFHFNPRAIFSAIPFVDGIVACDSFLHHASAALNGPKTAVLWGATSEEHLGYEDQLNLRKQKVYDEPNRIPHNRSWYVQKNKGCNEFGKEQIDELKAFFGESKELNKSLELDSGNHEDKETDK